MVVVGISCLCLGRFNRLKKSCRGTKNLLTNAKFLVLMLCERFNGTLAKDSLKLVTNFRDVSAFSQVKVKLQMSYKCACVKFELFTFICK